MRAVAIAIQLFTSTAGVLIGYELGHYFWPHGIF